MQKQRQGQIRGAAARPALAELGRGTRIVGVGNLGWATRRLAQSARQTPLRMTAKTGNDEMRGSLHYAALRSG